MEGLLVSPREQGNGLNFIKSGECFDEICDSFSRSPHPMEPVTYTTATETTPLYRHPLPTSWYSFLSSVLLNIALNSSSHSVHTNADSKEYKPIFAIEKALCLLT
jgi:hypothetical protein